MKKNLRADFPIVYGPWPFFFLFFFLNLLLSNGNLSLQTRLYLLLFGLVLPLLAGAAWLRATDLTRRRSSEWNAVQGIFHWPAWILAGALAIFLRFWHIGQPDGWLGGDEMIDGIGSIALYRHWNWDLFQALGQIPTTLSRICDLMLHLTHQPLFSFQFSNAFLSLLAVILGYQACRQHFTRSFSALVAFLIMFNFLSVWTARTGYSAAIFSLWEWGVFYFLGKFLSAPSPASKIRNAVFLGLVGGLGPYTMIPWPVVVFFVLVVLAWQARGSAGPHRTAFVVFIGSLLASLSPFLYLLFSGQYGGHILKVSAWNDFSWFNQLRVTADYFSALFWQYPSGVSFPPNDKFLNPVLGACFWLGVLELLWEGKKGLALGLGLFLSLLPGVLSNGFEPLRVFSILPFLLVLSALGIQALLEALRPGRRIPVLALILVVSAGIDAGRLYPSLGHFFTLGGRTPGYEGEGRQAYEFLQPLFSNRKPIYLFSDFIPEGTDQSLAFSTYFVNAAWNPDLPLDGIQWAGIFTDIHYVPLLNRRFPGSRWLSFSPSDAGKKSRHILGMIPVTEETAPVFRQWRDYNGTLQDINWNIINLPNGTSHRKVLKSLMAFYSRVPDDPFLQSCFFEKLVYNFSWENTFYPGDAWTSWANFSAIFRQSFDKSYKDLDLCEKFGRLLAVEGQGAEAKKLFEKALRLSPGNPLLNYEIQQLGKAL